MADTLNIAPDLALPIEAVTETFAILAKRGKGKTNTAVVMAEEMIALGMPVVIVDPVGVWWGIRASADGTGDGLPVVIFGGDHADVPLEPTAGELVADVLVDRRFPAVLDLSSLSKSAARRFMGPFVERLYHRNRDALHVIVDEADAFAPQRTQADGARLLGAMEDLVRRGRARGIGVTLITQRPAVLHKDVLTQAEVLIALGMTGPRDVAAIDEWVKLHADEDVAREVKASLPSLPVGRAWVWSPGWLDVLQKVQVRARRTFDSSATPKPGQRRRTPQQMAAIDLAELGQQIAETVDRAKADDPRELRRQITALRRELEEERAKPTPEPVEVRVEVPVLAPAIVDQLEALLEPAAALLGETQETLLKHRMWAEKQLTTKTPLAGRPSDDRVGQGRRAPSIPASPASRAGADEPRRGSRPSAGRGTDLQLRAGARRMVESLGRMAPLRLTKGQWGMVAGLKTTGGTWSTYLGEIRRLGFLDETSAGYTLSDAGFDYLGGRPEPMTAAELQDHYRSILRAGARKMLDALLGAHPEGLSREELGAAADIAITGGTFSTYLGELTRNGLAERADGLIFATDLLAYGAEA